MFKNSVFLQKYKEQLKSQVRLIKPDISEEKLEEIIQKQIDSIDMDKVNSKFIASEKNGKGEETKTNVLEVLDYLENEKPVITGFGAFYEQHLSPRGENVLLDMVQMLLDERKVYKKKKLSHANDEDPALFKLFDNYQLAFKLLNNSFFGITGQPQSIFFDPNFPSSIMYTGQIIIMTAIMTFEKISGGFYFDTLNDCLLYIDRIVKSENQYLDKLNLNIIPTMNDVFELLDSKFEGREYNKEILLEVLNNLDQRDLTKLYYKNNFLKFIENDTIKILLDEITNYELLDPNKPGKDIFPSLDEFWRYVKETCMYVYIPLNRTDYCQYHTRRTVLVVDTDSNFVYNKPFTKKLREFFPDKMTDYHVNMNKKLTCINISMYIFIKLIEEGYDHMGRMLNIDDKHRPVINMKNE